MNKLNEKYASVMDQAKPLPDRKRLQYELSVQAMKVTFTSNILKETIDQIVATGELELRNNCSTMFDILSRFGVPVLISSAGWADMIEHYMTSKGLLTQNVKVIGNFFSYDDNGVLAGIKGGQVIMPHNKQGNEKEAFEMHFQENSQRYENLFS